MPNPWAAAILMAREGASVLCVDRQPAAAGVTVDMTRAEGGEAEAFAADVTRADDCRAMVERALDAWGRLDILDNNVGIGGPGSVVSVTEEQWDRVMEVNVKSAEWATYKDNWRNQVMPVYLLGWYPDYIDPDNYTAAFAGTAGSQGNGIYFSDPQWDAMFVDEQKDPNEAVRAEIFKKVQQMWTDEVPTAPIFQGSLSPPRCRDPGDATGPATRGCRQP